MFLKTKMVSMFTFRENEMKTRQEMIYDFMLALAPNFEQTYADIGDESQTAARYKVYAELLADAYLEDLL